MIFKKNLFTIVTLLVILLATVFIGWKIIGKKSFKSNTVLLLGLCNAGKTVLFLQLRDNKFKLTQTSMKDNEATITIENGKSIHVVDFPGHERLRPKLKNFIPISGAIVFLIDAIEAETQIRTFAEYLYDLFTDTILNRRQIPIHIVCNKNDIVTAKRSSWIKTAIEKEIDHLRHTRKSSPGQEEQEGITLGTEGKVFTLDQLDNEVTFSECSTMKREIQPILDFINEKN